jgi:hypothetical protein
LDRLLQVDLTTRESGPDVGRESKDSQVLADEGLEGDPAGCFTLEDGPQVPRDLKQNVARPACGPAPLRVGRGAALDVADGLEHL